MSLNRIEGQKGRVQQSGQSARVPDSIRVATQHVDAVHMFPTKYAGERSSPSLTAFARQLNQYYLGRHTAKSRIWVRLDRVPAHLCGEIRARLRGGQAPKAKPPLGANRTGALSVLTAVDPTFTKGVAAKNEDG